MTTIALGIVAIGFGIGFLVFIHELGHFLLAKRSGVGVKEFSIGFGKKLWGFRKGETEYKICAIPLGGYVNMVGLEYEPEPRDDPAKSYMNKSKFTKLKILAGGVVFNLIFAILAMTLIHMHGTKQLRPNIVPIDGLPAAEFLVKGDEILKIGDVKVTCWREVVEAIKKYHDQPIDLTILRQNKKQEITINPVERDGEDIFGKDVKEWEIGIIPTGEMFMGEGLPVTKAFTKSLYFSGQMYVLTYQALGKLIIGEAKAEKTLGGPVMIGYLMTMSLKDSFLAYFHMLAIISLVLAIMNSMPIPILDGGHIMFLGIEAIRGKALKPRTMEIIQKFFFYLLIALAVFVTFIDITRFLH